MRITMRFIVDGMLGKLAVWLRLLGHDTLYARDLEDRQIIRISQQQERMIVTRDTGLARRKAARKCVLITADMVDCQLAEMCGRVQIGGLHAPSRCVHCNGELAPAGRDDNVRDSVPDHVYHSHDQFLRCASCGKIYWQGTHFARIRQTMRQAQLSP